MYATPPDMPVSVHVQCIVHVYNVPLGSESHVGRLIMNEAFSPWASSLPIYDSSASTTSPGKPHSHSYSFCSSH